MTRHTTDDTTNRRATTDDRETDDRRTTTDPTMRDVSHAHPETGETFGDSQVFERGTVVVADGGRSGRRDGDGTEEPPGDADDHDDEPMRDVDHTPREDAPGTNEVYARGGEGEDPTADDPDDAEGAE